MAQLAINTDNRKMQQLLGSKLYSDPMCFITEVVSNAKDSLVRSGNKQFIEVSLTKQEKFYLKEDLDIYQFGYWFVVKDRGTGLDKQEFVDKVCTLMGSDKENLPEEIGNKGLGKIAFSAFGKECFYTCIKDGKKTFARLYETEYDGIHYEILNEGETEEKNGVEFRIIVSNPINFKTEMFKKLAYFSDISYSIFGTREDNFSIYRNDLYQTSTLSNDPNLHITVDDVYYPLNFSKLNSNVIPIPLAIRFSLKDKVEVSTTRESVIYSEDLKKKIFEKIKLMFLDLVNKFNNLNDKEVSFKEMYLSLGKSQPLIIGNKSITSVAIDTLNFGLGSAIYKSPYIKGIENTTFFSLCDKLDRFVNSKGYFKSGKFTKKMSYLSVDYLFKGKAILINEYTKKNKIEYYKSIYEDFKLFTLKKMNLEFWIKFANIIYGRSFIRNEYINKKENKYRTFIETCKIFLEKIKENVILDFEVEIPKEFLESRRSNSPRKVLEKKKGDILIKVGKIGYRRVIGYTSEIQSLDTIGSFPKMTIYALDEEKNKLESICNLFHQDVRIALVSQREFKKIPKVHNFMEVNEFIKGDHSIFRRIVTRSVIANFINSNKEIFTNSEFIRDNLSSRYGEKLMELLKYKSSGHYTTVTDETMKWAIRLVEENNFWDSNIYSSYLEVKKEIDKLSFIKIFENEIAKINQSVSSLEKSKIGELIKIFKDLCKYYRFKMNWENYDRGSKDEFEDIIRE